MFNALASLVRVSVSCAIGLVISSCADSHMLRVDPSPTECPDEGWCWVRGSPTLSLGGSAAQRTAFAIGREGTFLLWQDGGWLALPVPTRATLVSAFVSSPTEIWASDHLGSAWHFDGAMWTEAPAAVALRALTGRADGSIWAVGEAVPDMRGGAISPLLRRQAGVWTQAVPQYEPEPPCLHDAAYILPANGEIWASNYSCDEDGGVRGRELRRFDGSVWQLEGERAPWELDPMVWSGGRLSLSGAIAWSAGGWVALDPEAAAQWDALPRIRADLEFVPAPAFCESSLWHGPDAAWCFAYGNLYFHDASGWRPTLIDGYADTRAGAEWGTIPPVLWAGGDATVAWGSSQANVYRVRPSAGSQLERFDGAAWSVVFAERVFDVDGAADDDVWIATAAGPAHFDGATFAAVPLPPALVDAGEQFRQVRALGGGAAMLSSGSRVLLYDGEWSALRPPGLGSWVVSFAGVSPTDLWIARGYGREGGFNLMHWDGAAWAERTDIGELSLLTSAGDRFWALSDVVIPLDMTAPRIASPPESSPYERRLWIGPDAIWVTAAGTALRHPLP